MRKVLTIVVFCFISQISMFSQEKYSGRVVSSKDRTPVAFANVVILANDSSFLAGGVTDEKGIYSIEIEEGKIPQLFKVTCIGYESLIQPMSLYPQEGATLVLKVHTGQLQEVTVLGKRKAFSLKDGTFIANVSTIPSLKNSGSIDDLLNSIPFVQGGGGVYSVLGTGGSATLYLDGQKVQDSGTLQRLRSQDIASVEVLNTPGVQYKASTKSIIKINYWCPLKIIAVFRNVCFVGQPTSWTCREPISGLKSQEKAKKRK